MFSRKYARSTSFRFSTAGSLGVMSLSLLCGWITCSAFVDAISAKPKVTYTLDQCDARYDVRRFYPHIKAEVALVASNYAEALKKGEKEIDRFFNKENSRLATVYHTRWVFAEEIKIDKLDGKIHLLPDDALAAMGAIGAHKQGLKFFWVYKLVHNDYVISAVPKPNNPYIMLSEYRTTQKWAGRRFVSPWLTDERIHQEEVEASLGISEDGRQTLDRHGPVLCKLDPDWCFPFAKRYDVLHRLENDPSKALEYGATERASYADYNKFKD